MNSSKLIYDRGTLVISDPPPDFGSIENTDFRWDERVSRYRTPGRYYEKVRKWIDDTGIEIEDCVFASNPRSIEGLFRAPNLRPYQETALELWARSNHRGIVVLPTGSGKTQLALSVIARMRSRTLCLVPTRALLDQWRREIEKHYDGPIGLQGDGFHTVEGITVSTYESAYRKGAELGNRFDLIIIDECHHFGAGLRDEILEMAIAPRRLGLTATPPSDSKWLDRLSALIGPVVFELTIGDLTGTYLADFDYYVLQVDLSGSERFDYELEISSYRDHFSKFRVACPDGKYADWIRFASRTEEGRNALRSYQRARKILANSSAKSVLLDTLLARHWKKKILIFSADTEMSYRIARDHLIMPITADIGRKERESMIDAFRAGKIKAIVSCRVLNEGLDVPDSEIAIILGGNQGAREHIQRIGRILRPSPGKRAMIYEIVCRGTLEIRQSRKRSASFASPIPYAL